MANHHFVELTSGDFGVTLSHLGAALVQLNYQGQNYCPERPESDLVPRYHGSVIAPWANRIADGQFEFEGKQYSVPVNETALNNSLHGLSADVPWEIKSRDESSCSFITEVGGIEGYPWKIRLEVSYMLTNAGLELSFSAKNNSDSTAPFSWAFHPYFQIPEADPEDWRITLPAEQYVEVNERLLPVQTRKVEGPFDFRNGAPCCFAGLDHAFGALPKSVKQGQLSAAGSRTLSIDWDDRSPWVQLHHPTSGVETVVIEPQSSPPDAFNSEQDLILLEPQVPFHAQVSVSVS